MNEEVWRTSTDPKAMLDWLRQQGTLSDRKARLFAVACCRRIWDLLTEQRSRQAIEIAESYADGKVDEEALDEASAAAEDVYQQINLDRNEPDSPAAAAASLELAAYAAWNACVSTWSGPTETHTYFWHDAGEVAATAVDSLGKDTERQSLERRHQAELIRCIFGSPSRAVSVEPAWLTPTVVALARSIYDNRAFDHLPILADALEEAGCDSADIFSHLRGPGLHARGCWPVDLILEKK